MFPGRCKADADVDEWLLRSQLRGGLLPAAAERFVKLDGGIEQCKARLRELVVQPDREIIHSLYGVGYKFEW